MEDALDNVIENMIQDIIDKRVLDILKTINKNYPEQFSRSNIKSELEYLKEHIIIKNTDLDLVKNEEISTGALLEGSGVSEGSRRIKINTKTKSKKEISNSERCNARKWSPEIICLKTGKPITKVIAKFRVSDYRDLDVDAFLSKYKIGNRCNNKINGAKYCKLHNQHLIHGDYFENPDKELCYHFLKGAKLV